ncbi:MAG: Na/Pi cotransporter family protein [Chitinophagaceae bacterium]|nr:Na/Pi cotransporter family protein [Chitinophagaceae bacterium]
MNSILLIVAGLVLFLYALNTLSQGLKDLAGDKLKRFLDKFTNNLLKGILSGIIVTVLLDSSSVVIIMTIALVNSKAMTFRQAMGVVMGANIGTTFSSQIFALNVGEYAAIPILGGFILMFFFKKSFYTNLGKVVFSFGLIFFGLFTMEEAVDPLKQSDYFISWLHSLENTWKGLFTGALVTVVVQSSSATVGMVIGLASENMITITAGIAVMLGAELGTCADTLIASIGRTKAAIKTGLFHLLFNVTTILVGMILLPFFTELVLFISKHSSTQQTIANAHMLFNGLGVAIMLPFVGLYESALDAVVGDRKRNEESFRKA